MKYAKAFKMAVFTAILALVMGCSGKEDPNAPLEPLGDFRLGHTIIVTKNAKMVPPSRRADLEAWKALMIADIDKRLGDYQGEKLYHIGVHIDSYVLAVPGIPLVAVPKSVLVVSLSVFDNATQQRLTEKPRQINALERSRKSTFLVGSGIVNSKGEQMENLSRNMARLIHKFLLENKVWFGVVEADAAPAQTATQ